MPKSEKPDTVQFIDLPTAPELFASAATGFYLNNGNIAITFESGRVDHSESPGPVRRVVVGRVMMPVAGAQALAIGLFDFLQKQGMEFKRPQ